MIYLYTLPGSAFNSPQANNCLINGYLRNNGLNIKHVDLSIKFLEKCLNSNYIKKNLKKLYDSLDKKERTLIDNIENTISTMKSKKINTPKIIKANDDFLNVLKIYGNHYNVTWTRRGLAFNFKINTVDDLLNIAYTNKLFDEILKKEKFKEIDIIYLSIQYPFQIPYAIRFSKIIKDKCDNVKIIFGGDYITHIIKNCRELMTKCSYIDGIVFFSNHRNLLELINYYENNNNSKIFNTMIRIENKIIENKLVKNDFKDIDKYIPYFDDLDLSKYLSNLKLLSINLNYGCYHSKCKFCSRNFYFSGYCKYNINKICELIKDEYKNNSIEAIYFIDECVPVDILIKISKYLIENKIKIIWMVETRIEDNLLDKKIAELLYKSGCREISFGIESYNKKILKDMDKRINLKTAKKVMKNFYDSGISVSATFMIGYPTENMLNILRTLHFIKKFKYIDTFGLGVFNYLRNSILVNESKLNEEEDLNLMYRTSDDKVDYYSNLIERFNNCKKINKYASIRRKIMYRAEYMYLDRSEYSLNFKNKEKR